MYGKREQLLLFDCIASMIDRSIYSRFRFARRTGISNVASATSVEMELQGGTLHLNTMFQIRIWIRIHRIHIFMGLLDPDPLVGGIDPDPSVIK